MKTCTALVMALAAPLAVAHDGHGLAPPHWHASDVFGYIALGAVVAAAWWASRRK